MSSRPIRLSRHAEERWRERVGRPLPTPEDVARIIRESVRTQNFRLLLTPRGRPIVVLASYEHRGLGVTLKVDEKHNTVVTVL